MTRVIYHLSVAIPITTIGAESHCSQQSALAVLVLKRTCGSWMVISTLGIGAPP